MSESDVCKHQILTSKVDPLSERVKTFYNGCTPIIYSNEAERSDYDICDDFKLKITLWSLGLYKKIQRLKGY